MGYNLDKLKKEHADWYDIITTADHNDVLAYHDIAYAAMSNNERAQNAISAAFPGCREAVADWYTIGSACAELMSDAEVERSANDAERFLNFVSHEGPGLTGTYERMIDKSLPRLRTLRVSAGLSQQALADAAKVNISQVQKLEAGTALIENITLKNAIAFADALGVDVRDLL